MNQIQLVQLLKDAGVPVDESIQDRRENPLQVKLSRPHGSIGSAVIVLVGGGSHEIDGYRDSEYDDGYVIARTKNQENGFVAIIPEHVVSVLYFGSGV